MITDQVVPSDDDEETPHGALRKLDGSETLSSGDDDDEPLQDRFGRKFPPRGDKADPSSSQTEPPPPGVWSEDGWILPHEREQYQDNPRRSPAPELPFDPLPPLPPPPLQDEEESGYNNPEKNGIRLAFAEAARGERILYLDDGSHPSQSATAFYILMGYPRDKLFPVTNSLIGARPMNSFAPPVVLQHTTKETARDRVLDEVKSAEKPNMADTAAS